MNLLLVFTRLEPLFVLRQKVVNNSVIEKLMIDTDSCFSCLFSEL